MEDQVAQALAEPEAETVPKKSVKGEKRPGRSDQRAIGGRYHVDVVYTEDGRDRLDLTRAKKHLTSRSAAVRYMTDRFSILDDHVGPEDDIIILNRVTGEVRFRAPADTFM